MDTICSDEEIAKQVQEGDHDAFGVLMMRFEPKLMRYGTNFLPRREDITDIVQEVFIKAYTNIMSFDPKRKFSSWIYRIAHNHFVNKLRKKELGWLSFDIDEFLPHPISNESPLDELLEQEVKKELEQGLDLLSQKYKEVLLLYYYENLDYEQIADVLHIPVGTVGIRLRRGRESLKVLLDNIE